MSYINRETKSPVSQFVHVSAPVESIEADGELHLPDHGVLFYRSPVFFHATSATCVFAVHSLPEACERVYFVLHIGLSVAVRSDMREGNSQTLHLRKLTLCLLPSLACFTQFDTRLVSLARNDSMPLGMEG